MAYDIGPKIGIDGEAGFRKSIQNINSSMRTLQSELRVVKSAYEGQADSTEALTKTNEVLRKELTQQNSKLAESKKMLEQAKTKYGENSTECQRWQTVVNNAQTEVNKLSNQIRTNDRAIDTNRQSYDRLNKVLSISGKQVDDLSGVIGSDLVRSIKDGTAGSKDLDSALERMAETSTGSKVDIDNLKGAIDAIAPGSSLSDVEDAFSAAGASASEGSGSVEVFGKSLDVIAATQALEMLSAISEKIGELGQKALDAYGDVEAGTDSIVLATGATGEAADAFADVYKAAAENVVGDLGDIGGALGEINTRFGYTDDKLQTATESFMKFSQITGTDAVESVRLVSRMMNEAGLEASDYQKYLDELAVAGQATGVSVSSLAQAVTTNGASMRELGLTTEESIALLAGFETAGVDTNTALAGMKKAVQNWSKSGKDAGTEFKNMLKGLEDGTVSYADASAVFGGKATTAIMNMAQSGKFSIADMMGVLEESGGTVSDTYEEWAGGTQQVDLAQQKMTLAWSEFGESIMTVFAPAMSAAADMLMGIADGFNALPEGIQTVVGGLGALALAVPAATGVFSALHAVMGPIASSLGITSGAITGFLSAAAPVAGVVAGVAAVLYGCWQNSESFRNAVMSLVTSLQTSLAAAIETVSPIIDTAREAFDNVMASLNPFLERLGDLLANIFPPIQSFFEWIIPTVADVLAACQPFITAIGDFLSAVLEVGSAVIALVTGDFSGCWEHLTSAAGSAFDGIKNVFSGIFDVGSAILTDLWDGLISGVQTLWDNIAQWGSDVWQNILDGIGNIGDIGKAIVDGIWAGISGGWEDFKTNLGNWASDVGTAVMDFFGIHSPSKMFSEFGGYLSEGLAEGIGADDTVTTEIGAMCTSIDDTFRAGLEIIRENLKGELSTLITEDSIDTSAVTTAVEQMSIEIRANVENLAGAFDTIFAELRQDSIAQTELLYSQATKLYTSLSETSQRIVSEMSKAVTNLYTSMSRQLISMSQSLQANVIKVMTSFSVTYRQLWTTISTQTVAAVTLMSNQVVSQTRTMASGMVAAVSPLPEKFNSIGVSAMTEFIAGMKSKESDMLTTAGSLVQKLVDKFKEGLGIHSPSRVMRDQIGAMVLAGLIQGMSEKDMIAFVEKYVGDMQDSFGNGKLKIGTLIDTLDDDGAKALIEYLNTIDGTTASVATSVYPLAGGPYDITSWFGARPASDTNGIGTTNHGGIDIGAPSGTAIRSTGAGTVTLASYNGGYGNCVIVDHGNGLVSLYGHMSSIGTSAGSAVKAGDVIGYVGSTGNSTGPHLHFEMRKDGEKIDPYPYLQGAAISGGTLAQAIENALTLRGRGITAEAINAMGSNVVLNSGSSSLGTINAGAYTGVSGTLTDWVTQACNITGEPLTSVAGLITAAMAESSGNPYAVNDWDSNAAAGTPSKGLMQTIDSTFQAYKVAGMDDIWNPVHNLVAAIRYMRDRYGSVSAVLSARSGGWYGYSVGTRMVPDNMLAMIHKNEAILPASQNPYTHSGGEYLKEIVAQVVKEAGSSGDSRPIVVNIQGDIQKPSEITKQVRRTLREYGIKAK